MKPSFTIVIPVYNGGSHLKQCVESVLSQSVEEFELAILENCSDDGSREWLSTLQDSRVRIYSSSSLLNIEDNWARAVQIPKNEFVTFMGHDDLLDPNYLEIMQNCIEAHPGAALYHAHFRFINEEGHVLKPCRPMPLQETPAQFCEALLQFKRDANGTGYVARSRDFDRFGGFPHFHRMLYADHALWLSLVRDSFLVTAPQECFSYRIHTSSTTASSQPQDYMRAIKQFIVVIKQAEHWDEETVRVVGKYAPQYFRECYKHEYMVAIVKATQEDRCLDLRVFKEFAEEASRVGYPQIKQMSNSKEFRLRRIINSSTLARRLYNFAIRFKHGKSGRSTS